MSHGTVCLWLLSTQTDQNKKKQMFCRIILSDVQYVDEERIKLKKRKHHPSPSLIYPATLYILRSSITLIPVFYLFISFSIVQEA